MKTLRNSKMARIVSLVLLLTIIQPLAAPYYAMALTHGAHQPEYTSYEEPGATDMVNLLTGDFTYSLPVMEVPGPSGSFSLPLTYNAGIGPEQESSWVGLGWNINVGAITRNINQFPDDASGESQTVRVMDLTGIRGWQSSALGFGTIGWNSLQGHYGNISVLGILNGAWDENSTTLGVAGVNVGKGEVSFNAVQFGIAVMTVATFGSGAAASTGVSIGASIARQAAIELAVNAAVSLAVAAPTPSAPTVGYWKYSKHTRQRFLHKDFKIWLDQTRVEDMYGTLYSGRAPIVNLPGNPFPILSLNNSGTTQPIQSFQKTSSTGFNEGSASDINYQIDDDKDFLNSHNPSFQALDDYTVGGPGVSGSIEPYRLDIGSVSMPREMTSNHDRLAIVPYKDYKVPFKYKGSSGEYFHHVGGASSVTSPEPYFGVDLTMTGQATTVGVRYDLSDVTYKDQPVRSDVAAVLSAGNSVNKLPQGRHVEWLTNSEIRGTQTYPSGFVDFLTYDDRQAFRAGAVASPTTFYGSAASFNETIPVANAVASAVSKGDYVTMGYSYEVTVVNNGVQETQQRYSRITTQVVSKTPSTLTLSGINSSTEGYGLPVTIDLVYNKTPQIQNGIGGYVVTGTDGTSYHYALPIYDYGEITEIIDKTDANKKSVLSRVPTFANTWLLTAITGSDFVDRNANGIADDGDWGYWVKFNYGKHDDDYQWRIPFSGYKRDSDDKMNIYSTGYKEIYYLNTIETASHVALFLKSPRLDSQGFNGATLLKLDEVCLLTKEHYRILTTASAQGGYGIADYSNKINSVCLTSGISSSALAFMNRNTLKRVGFSYSYDLCGVTPNSQASSKGKLTLTRISLKGKNDIKIVPDYIFQYGNNVVYGTDYWDGWDMYNSAGTSSGTTHGVSSDGTQWSLNKITTPLGGEIAIGYERDSYSNVSGLNVIGSRILYSQGSKDWSGHDTNDLWTGGAGSPLSNAIDQGILKVGSVVNMTGTASLKCVDGTSSQSTDYNTRSLRVVYIDKQAELIRFGQQFFTQPYCSGTEAMIFNSNQGTMEILNFEVPGGDIRVSSITMTDETGVVSKIRYLYAGDDGNTSGSVAQEPEYGRHELNLSAGNATEIYNLPFYPRTPVMYGKVTVLNGALTSDDDYHTKTVYEFETPSQELVVYQPRVVLSSADQKDYKPIAARSATTTPPTTFYTDYAYMKEHVVQDYSSKIGMLKSIKIFQSDGVLINSTTMTNGSQITSSDGSTNAGVYTQGTLMFDLITSPDSYLNRYHKIGKTTVISHQYEVVKMETVTRDGFRTTTQNSVWDRYTGDVLDQSTTTSLGLSVRTVNIPAYAKYPGMGPKALGGKNMLAASAASYAYKTNAVGVSIGLIGAQAQTWSSDWNNYRTYSSSGYADGGEGPGVWRKAAIYAWKGSYQRLLSDGSQQFSTVDEFNFTAGAVNNGWQKAGETVQYDHFSMPLEVRDINNLGMSTKMGYNDRMIIAQASNAYYTEMAFSGAEDLLSDRPYFGGEVALGNGTVLLKSKGQTTATHTGDAVVSLSTGTSFVYKTNKLRQQSYRAKVWATSDAGKLYYKINGGTEVTSTVSRKVGNWYLLSIEIPITSAVGSFEIGVKATAGTVQFDDFRFQPLKSNMSCYVYASPGLDYTNATSLASFDYMLNDDNLYTKFEYNELGQLSRTYQESFQYGEKLVSENKMYYKRVGQ